MADIDEAGDALARFEAEAVAHAGMEGAPFCQPVGDKAHRMRRDQQGLAHRAGGEELLPFGNRDRLAHPTDHAHDHRRAQESEAFHVEAFRSGLGFGFQQALGQHLAHAAAGVTLEHDEAPGKQLAMVGHPRRRGQDRLELRRRRPRTGHGLGRARPAGQQQVDRVGGGTVKGGRCGIHVVPMPNCGGWYRALNPYLTGRARSPRGLFTDLARSFVIVSRPLL